MARFAWPGSAALRRRGLHALAAAAGLALTAGVVLHLDRQRQEPDLARLAAEHARLAAAHRRLQALPPVRPVHFQMRRLRQLARTLPGLEPIAAVRAEPDAAGAARWPEHFGGEVWRAALAGPLLSVAALCRLAQPALPLLVDTIEARDGRARAEVLVFGTAAAEET